MVVGVGRGLVVGGGGGDGSFASQEVLLFGQLGANRARELFLAAIIKIVLTYLLAYLL